MRAKAVAHAHADQRSRPTSARTGYAAWSGHGFVKGVRQRAVVSGPAWGRDDREWSSRDRPRIPLQFRHCSQARGMAEGNLLADLSRKYDLAEHTYPAGSTSWRRSSTVWAVHGQLAERGATGSAKAETPNPRRPRRAQRRQPLKLGALVLETTRGDVSLALSIPAKGWATRRSPRSPTTNRSGGMPAAGRRWRSPNPIPVLTPAPSRTTAVRDGDHYVLNGERSSSPRAARRVGRRVGDAGPSLGKQAIKSLRRRNGGPTGLRLVRLGTNSAFGPRTRPHSCSGLPGACRGPARRRGCVRSAAGGAARCRPSTTPDRSSRRWRWA